MNDPAPGPYPPAPPPPVPSSPEPPVQWSRLSRRMLVVHPAVEVARIVPVVVAVVFLGNRNLQSLVSGLVVVVLTASVGLVRWFTTRYRVSDTQVQLRHGLVRRREVAVRRERVRTVDVEATPLHRLVGLTRLKIGTGRSDRGEQDSALRLDGLTVVQAERLRSDLLDRTPSSSPGVDTSTSTGDELLVLDPSWVRYGPFTLTGLVSVAAVVALGWRAVNEAHVDVVRNPVAARLIAHVESTPPWLLAVQGIVTVVVLGAVFSTVGWLLAFWHMRVVRTGHDTLHITRGLLTARAITLAENRIRGVELSEPLLLRLVGGARLIAVATGLRVGRGSERGGSLLVPPAPAAVSRRVAGAVLYDAHVIGVALVRHPRTAGVRRITRAVVPAAALAVVIVAAGVLFGDLGPAAAVAVLVIAAAVGLAVGRVRALGHRLTDHHLVVQEGCLVRRRTVLQRDSAVAVTVRATLWQRRAGLATVQVATAAGRQSYRVLDTDRATADAVAVRIIGSAASAVAPRP